MATSWGMVFLWAVGALLAVLATRFAIAYLNTSGSDRFQKALNRTARWLGIVVGGLTVAASVGLVQFGDIIGQIFAFIGGHPFVVSNLAGISIGAGVMSGVLDLTVDQYVGIALAIAGAVFVLSEVETRA
jgi:hypothetical protein